MLKELKEEGCKRVVIVGLAFQYAVAQTALFAKKEGFEVIVINDATASFEGGNPMFAKLEREMEHELKKKGVL